VRDWSDIKRASDLLAKNKITLTWGPLRHIIGHSIAIYHKNPDGVVIEFFCRWIKCTTKNSATLSRGRDTSIGRSVPRCGATTRRLIGGDRCHTGRGGVAIGADKKIAHVFVYRVVKPALGELAGRTA